MFARALFSWVFSSSLAEVPAFGSKFLTFLIISSMTFHSSTGVPAIEFLFKFKKFVSTAAEFSGIFDRGAGIFDC